MLEGSGKKVKNKDVNKGSKRSTKEEVKKQRKKNYNGRKLTSTRDVFTRGNFDLCNVASLSPLVPSLLCN
jgi:hypothetical protein